MDGSGKQGKAGGRQAALTLGFVAAFVGVLVSIAPAADLRPAVPRQLAQGFGGTMGGVGQFSGSQFGGGQFGGGGGGFGGPQFGAQFGGFGGGFGGGQFGGGGGQFGGGFGAPGPGQFGSQFGGSGGIDQSRCTNPQQNFDLGGNATSVRLAGSTLKIEAALAPSNSIRVVQTETGCFEVSEEGAANPDLNAGGGCRQILRKVVACDAQISLVEVNLKGGDDELFAVLNPRMNVQGGTGADALFGGSGADVLDGETGNDFLAGAGAADTYSGGSGDDEIAAVDGVRDSVSCGIGRDALSVDLTDPNPLPVSASCEDLERSPVRSFPNLGVDLRKPLRARANGTVPLRVGCPKDWKPGCKGTIALDDGRGKRPAKLGSLKYSVRPGKARTLNVRLSARGRAYVAARSRSTVRVGSSERDADGRPRTVFAQLTVLAPKRT